ncbi:MAG: hypothetical protein IJO97_04850 [Lachnospiraceae bacterium]|nr:hypothetical protein [Lachnospiraceae bacterium]
MVELYRKIRESKLPWFLFYIGLTIELGMVIIDKSNYVNPIEGYLFRITFLIFALKLMFTGYSIKEWVVIFFLEVIGFISYRATGENDIIRIVTFVAACKDIPLKQMIRYAFYITTAGCVMIVLLAVTGIYGDMSLTLDYGRGYEQTRYTLGMGHPNALSCMFLMLLAMGIYTFSERMKWYSYLFLMLLNVGVFWLTDSKTSMLITTLLLMGTFVITYSKFLREKWFVYACGLLIFVLCIAFSVDAAVNAQNVREAKWNESYYGEARFDAHVVGLLRIDEQINGRIVSLTNSENKDGTIETWSMFSCPNNMTYYFDMGWVKLFYRYGVIPGILYCIANLALLWQFYRKKDAFGLVIFSVLAIYSVVEAHLFSVYVGRNFLLMMMGSYLLTGQDIIPVAQKPSTVVNQE